MDGGYMDLDLLPKRSLLERSLLGTAADDQISDPVLHSLEHTTFLRKIMDGKFGPNFLFCNSSGHFQVRKG